MNPEQHQASPGRSPNEAAMYLSVLGAKRVTILYLPALNGVKPCSGHSYPSSSFDNTKLIINLDAGSPLHIQTNDNSNIALNLDAGNPLHIQTNDNSNIALNLDAENYRIWASAMKLALHARNEFSFFNGSCLKESYATSNVLSAQ
nr:putative Gag-polypeptide of LTR copia-type [Tanacetum cinerariifolium]